MDEESEEKLGRVLALISVGLTIKKYLKNQKSQFVPDCIPDWKCEQPLNGYESDGCGNRRLNIECNISDTDYRPSGYILKWSDEFNNNTIGSNWFIQGGYATNASIHDGSLYLKVDVANNQARFPWIRTGTNSSNLKTYGPYGYFVAKVKYSFKINVNNQMWFTGFKNNSDNWTSELDFEMRREIKNGIEQSHHGFAYCKQTATTGCDANWGSGKNAYNVITDNNWHIISVLWTPSKYEWWIDGIKKAEMTDISYIGTDPTTISFASCASYPDPGCPMHNDRRALLNTNELPTYFIIDYIRFYQQ